MSKIKSLMAGAAIALAAAAAHAQTLIDTIGPDFTPVFFDSTRVGQDQLTYDLAFRFSPEASGLAAAANLLVYVSTGPRPADYRASNVQVSIRADSNGTPGAILTSSTVELWPGFIFDTRFVFDTPTQINAGEHYWVDVQSQYNTIYVSNTALGFTGTKAELSIWWNGWKLTPGAVMPAFSISAVPNPPAYLMLSLGMLTLAARARRRG